MRAGPHRLSGRPSFSPDTRDRARPINDLERKFLKQGDVAVLLDRAMALPTPDGMCGATPEYWLETTVEAARPDTDGYFVSCTNIQSVDAIADIEKRLLRPAVTSNQAAMWYALRHQGRHPGTRATVQVRPAVAGGAAAAAKRHGGMTGTRERFPLNLPQVRLNES
jgi:hypothetical protein